MPMNDQHDLHSTTVSPVSLEEERLRSSPIYAAAAQAQGWTYPASRIPTATQPASPLEPTTNGWSYQNNPTTNSPYYTTYASPNGGVPGPNLPTTAWDYQQQYPEPEVYYPAPAVTYSTQGGWNYQRETVPAVQVPPAIHLTTAEIPQYHPEDGARVWDNPDEVGYPPEKAVPAPALQHFEPQAGRPSRETKVYNLETITSAAPRTPYAPDYSGHSMKDAPLPSMYQGFPEKQDSIEAFATSPTAERHPRVDLLVWKWRALLVALNLLAMINGYDVSNVANVQVPIYQYFMQIEYLPWVSLSYSVCNVAVIPLARRLFKFYDFKILSIFALVVFVAGCALSGAAPNMQALIVGRALMAVGAAFLYQGILSFSAIFAYPNEISIVQASVGVSFAVGLFTGPIIGGALADRSYTAWRWAFYLPIFPSIPVGLLLLLCLPNYRLPSSKSVSTHFREIDYLGAALHAATIVLFGVACTFSGAIWPWTSGSSIGIWFVLAAVAVAYTLQQALSLGTTPELRIFFPWIMLLRRRGRGVRTLLLTTTICTACGAAAYGVVLYYVPMFFAFTRDGLGPLDTAVRLLPFIGAFIVAQFLAGALLPRLRYYAAFYLAGAACLILGGGLCRILGNASSGGGGGPSSTSSAVVLLVAIAIIGAGVGTIWQLGIPVCSVLYCNSSSSDSGDAHADAADAASDRLDLAAVHNLAQMGGTAISLSVAAAVYQNVGFRLIRDGVGHLGFPDATIRELLAGWACPLLAGRSPEVKDLAVRSVADVIGRCLYLPLIAGAACLAAALCMRFEDAARFEKPPAAATATSGQVIREVYVTQQSSDEYL
ncbi:major facilitator superfamily domain-containing protein [Xylariomycetidae sp. FL2044]|nr:major facilitator superfamily domain-containing protein [Xylariomycetidae sp. FL2044]